MRAVDTNILARYYLGDDPEQSRLAREILSAGDVFIPKSVLLELEWVLRAVAEQPRSGVLDCLRHLTGLPGILVEDREQVESALAASAHGIDFADALHHASSLACEEMLSFDDRGFARRGIRHGMQPPVRVPQG